MKARSLIPLCTALLLVVAALWFVREGGLSESPAPTGQTLDAESAATATRPAVGEAAAPLMAPAPLVRLPAAAEGEWTRFGPNPGLQSKIRIEGTSTMHDWQVESSLVGGLLEIGPAFPLRSGATVKPGAVDVRATAFIPVGSLKSLKENGTPYSTKMDDILHEKLLLPVHSRILYQLDGLTLVGSPASEDAPCFFDSVGKLVVAGVTNVVTMPVKLSVTPDQRVRVSGTLHLRMSAFNIEPPALTVLGVGIKTGDDVKVFFEWELVAQ